MQSLPCYPFVMYTMKCPSLELARAGGRELGEGWCMTEGRVKEGGGLEVKEGGSLYIGVKEGGGLGPG